MFEMQYTYFIIMAPATIVAGILITIQAWSQRENPGAKQFTAAMILAIGWLTFNSLEMLAASPQYTILWARITYIFITTTPVAFFLFATQFFWKEEWLRKSLIPILFIIPVMTILIIWLPNYTPLIWQSITFQQIGRYLILRVAEYGFWFWMNAVYTYGLTIISMLLMLVYIFRASTLYRHQSFWILLSIIFPVGFNIIYIFRLIPSLQKDFTPISFALSGIMISMGIYRSRLFDLSPMAREVIIDKIDDGFIISDRFNRIIDMNPSAAEIFQVKINAVLGQPIESLLTDWHQIPNEKTVEQYNYTINVSREGKSYYYELKVSKLQNKHAVSMGTIVLLRDVTDRVELLEEVQQLAIQDGLTKIYNRRHFYELAQRAFSQSTRYHRPVSILLMDIDLFKSINDTYGHLAGDHVLQYFAQICVNSIRKSDILARFGGEEFILMMPETGAKNAVIVAERLKEQFGKIPVSWNQHKFNVTVSIGVASLPPGAAPILLDTLIDQADRALYHAKQTGRNRVSLASEVLQ